MNITIIITAEIEHREGKFASKEELAEALVYELDGMDPGEVYGDDDGRYETTDWQVEAAPEKLTWKRSKSTTGGYNLQSRHGVTIIPAPGGYDVRRGGEVLGHTRTLAIAKTLGEAVAR